MTNLPMPRVPDRRRDNTKTRAEKNRSFRAWLKARKRQRKENREMLEDKGIDTRNRLKYDDHEARPEDFDLITGTFDRTVSDGLGTGHTWTLPSYSANFDVLPMFRKPFKCEPKKHANGWRVLDNVDRVAGIAQSRTKQRELRDKLNKES